MYNLVLTGSIYFFMSVSAGALLAVILHRQERHLSLSILSRLDGTIPVYGGHFHHTSGKKADSQGMAS